MWSFVGARRDVWWVWVALDAETRQVVAMVVGDRSEFTARCLWEAVPEEYRRRGDGLHRLPAGLPGGAARRPPRRLRQGGRADRPRRAVLVHGAAAVRPIRPQDAVVLEVRLEPHRGAVVLRPPLQRIPTIGPLPSPPTPPIDNTRPSAPSSSMASRRPKRPVGSATRPGAFASSSISSAISSSATSSPPPAREGRPPGKQGRLREQVVALRKQNLSVHDISRALARDGELAQPGGGRRDPQGGGVRQAAAEARRRAARPAPARRGRRRRRPPARPDPAPVPHQVRRPVPVPPVADLRRPGPAPRAGRIPRVQDGPGRVRGAVAAGPEALRQRAPQPRHERRARRGAGPLRRIERHPQAVVPDRVQLPDRPGLLSGVDARLVRHRQPARA